MSLIEIRKDSLIVESTYHESGPIAAKPVRLAAACAKTKCRCMTASDKPVYGNIA